MSIAATLTDLKDRVEKLHADRMRLEGQLQAALDTLEKDYGCKSIAQAEKKLAAMEAEVQSEEEDLAKECDRIKALFDKGGG